jgi:hypothetical protein
MQARADSAARRKKEAVERLADLDGTFPDAFDRELRAMMDSESATLAIGQRTER